MTEKDRQMLLTMKQWIEEKLDEEDGKVVESFSESDKPTTGKTGFTSLAARLGGIEKAEKKKMLPTCSGF